MKKLKLFLPLLFLGMLVLGAGSCDKDEDVRSWFDEIENEYVEFELKGAPAYVEKEEKEYEYVFISYSKYVDEYYDIVDMPAYSKSSDPTSFSLSVWDTLEYEEVRKDIKEKMIAIKSSDFKKFNIPIPSKVYITASVTNNDTRKTEGMTDLQIEYIRQAPQPRKAYLKDVRLR